MTLPELLPSIGYAAPPRFHPAIWPLTSHSDDEGRLCIGDVPLTEVADEFRTPTYVIDEADFRSRARRYHKALRHAEVVYAGKSLLTIAVARWAREEGLGVDVCSVGELTAAIMAGVQPARMVMHGNAKSSDELRAAVRVGVGRIVLDSCSEIVDLAGVAPRRQRVLIRVTPDIDIHGHRAVTTGISDQKFGFTLDGGQAADAVARVVAHPDLDLIGLHCHIGSQVTDATLYGEAIHRMIAVMADIRTRHGVILTELNIGGGHAVPYVAGDPELNIDELARVIDDALDTACAAEHFPRPVIVVEPGRAISARAGVTLYQVCGVKTQPGGRTFVAVDG
ncbi:MAG: diaminopimelate decarboxylase, partial [Mycobacterium sp.]